MSAPNTTKWIGLGLLGLPLYGMLTFWTTLDPQPDPNTDYEAWARYVSTNYYVLKHLFSSILGLVFAIFGVFALGAYLAKGSAGRLGLVAMVITVAGNALFLPLLGVSAFAAPEEGQAYLVGIEECAQLDPGIVGAAQGGHLSAGHCAPLRGQRAPRSSRLALGDATEVGRSPLGSRGRVDVPAEYGVRDDAWSLEHPAKGARGRVAAGDTRGMDGLECDAQTFETARGRRSAQGTVTPAELTTENFQ